MAVTMDMIKALREQTQAGVLDCKKALEASDGDMAKATEILREKGIARAAKKADRVAAEGMIEAYVHPGNKLAVLIEVNCETDFVSATDNFKNLCHDLAMQVAAANPSWLSRADVPEDVLAEEKERYLEEMAGQNKPENIMERIIEGKLAKFYQEKCLLDQLWIRDDEKTIETLIKETIGQIGENIVIKRFARYQMD